MEKKALDNQAIKKEIIDFIGKRGIEMLKKEYSVHRSVFPLVVVDGVPISFNLYFGQAIRNHINSKFHVLETTDMDYTQYEDYIYEMVKNIIEEYEG